MLRKILIIIVIIGIIGAMLAMLAWRELQDFEARPFSLEGEATLWLAPGSSYPAMVRELSRLGLTSNDWRWQWLGRLRNPMLKAGEYRLVSGDNPASLFEQMRYGGVVNHRLTVIEGWTTEQLRKELANDSRLQQQTAGWSDAQLMQQLGCSECFSEGRFLPETYFFVRGDSDFDVLQRAYDSMQQVLNQAWQQRDPELPIDHADELLVLASLIEMETTDPRELTEVAGVFKRRLQTGMRLQTDPTVVYGIESRQDEPFDGRIRRVHLQTDHPWNTYTRRGLPPTPIGLPGLASIQAAARPAEGDTLYFVAKGDGTHQFSRTLAEHNRAVDRYIRGRN
ncbi:MAG: endolytic transglycosylase MltG [Pseudomonadota bacterium]